MAPNAESVRPAIDPDNELPDDLRGEVANGIWTGRPVHDTFSMGEPPHRWVIAGCDVPEAVYRRHVELAERIEPLTDQLATVDACLRDMGLDAWPREEAMWEAASRVKRCRDEHAPIDGSDDA